jgi:tRNA(fMet)-specific endonuclease VapC
MWDRARVAARRWSTACLLKWRRSHSAAVKSVFQNLLRVRDPGSGGAQNLHILPCMLRRLALRFCLLPRKPTEMNVLDSSLCVYYHVSIHAQLIRNAVKTAKVFIHGNSQAVRLPKEFRFEDVVAELRYGAEKSKRREKNLAALERFLADFDIEPFDERATRQYGVIRSVAVSLDAILVTNNTGKFQRVPGLKVENWLS